MKDERDLFYDDDISSIIDPSYEMKAMSHHCPTTTRMKTKLNAGEPVTRIPGTVIAGESEKKKRRETGTRDHGASVPILYPVQVNSQSVLK